MCHVSILLFLSCLPVCPFLTKLINLALVILTSKGFEMSIYIPSNVWHNLFYMTWIFPYMITEAIHLLDNALIVISRNDSPWSRLGCLHGTTPTLYRHWLNTCVPSEIGTPRNMATWMLTWARVNELIRNNQACNMELGPRVGGIL